jgi:methionyl-tRNA synthetase
VSRPTERIHWGIRVPGDETQTIYVWLDALVNYITVIGYPENGSENASASMIHVVGKDIAKFHCVYWPAFLHGAGLPLPRMVLNHGHWLKNKMKMSKSIGNVVDPFSLLADVGVNSVRSYFLSEGPLLKDSNFELESLIEHHNKTICDQYVNMLFRITGKKILKEKQNFPPPAPEHINHSLIDKLNVLSLEAQDLYS